MDVVVVIQCVEEVVFNVILVQYNLLKLVEVGDGVWNFVIVMNEFFVIGILQVDFEYVVGFVLCVLVEVQGVEDFKGVVLQIVSLVVEDFGIFFVDDLCMNIVFGECSGYY